MPGPPFSSGTVTFLFTDAGRALSAEQALVEAFGATATAGGSPKDR